jgi:hypothetical protein
MQTPTMRRLLGPVAVIGLLAGLVAAAPAANAKVVLGQSIAGVRLGESQSQVTAQLGAPTKMWPPDTKGRVEWNYDKPPLVGAVTFAANGELTGMWTLSKWQRTTKGIGVGSSLAQVKKAYPKVKCITGPFGPKSVICILKSKLGGRVVETDFPFFIRSMGAREVDIDFA